MHIEDTIRLTIISALPVENFRLVLEFNNCERRLFDLKEFLKGDIGLLGEIRNDIDLFKTVSVDRVSGTIRFANDMDFDPEILYQASKPMD
mgnify:CR=1 FL=1